MMMDSYMLFIPEKIHLVKYLERYRYYLDNKRMFLIHMCRQISENSYDSQLEKSRKNEICKTYHLENKGEYKEYWENNVCILVSENSRSFNYIEDKLISYNNDKNYLLHEINIKPCIPYNFFDVHHEEKYTLYENEINNVRIQLKGYNTYLTLTFQMENITHLDELNNFLYLV